MKLIFGFYLFLIQHFVNFYFSKKDNSSDYEYSENDIENYLTPKPHILIKGNSHILLSDDLALKFLLTNESISEENSVDDYQQSIYNEIISLYEDIFLNFRN